MPKPRNKRYSYILERLIDLGSEQGSVVIDCACGDGYGSSILVAGGMDVCGYDIQKDLVDLAVDRGIEAQKANICKLPCDTDYADIFVCSETLEHLDEVQVLYAVQEIMRVTKVGGIVCITVPLDKQMCLNNKYHKQYLSVKKLIKLFNIAKVVFKGKFHKTESKSNTVILFRR